MKFLLPFIAVVPLLASIQVDQFGYPSDRKKIAVLKQAVIGTDAKFDTLPVSDSAQLVTYPEGDVVFAGPTKSWNSGAVHAQSGDRAWTFDFTSVSLSGKYQIIAGGQKSHPFEIRENPYRTVLKIAAKMLYYQRCNFAKSSKYATNWADAAAFELDNQDRKCRFLFDSTNTSLVKDLHGGWFDAGDYNKYISFIPSPAHHLLFAYERNPLVFTDDFDIPESGNGLPDILDELKWELDWMLRMQNEDGSVILKMGQKEFAGATPPSSATFSRFYGKTSSAAAIALASTTAHAAIVYRQFSQWKEYADSLSRAAEKSFSYFQSCSVLDTAVDNGEIKAGDADWTEKKQREEEITAAIWLFALTGKSSYNEIVKAKIGNASHLYWWGPYEQYRSETLLKYSSISGADPTVVNKIQNAKRQHIGSTFYVETATIDPWGIAIPDNQFHWGSNAVLCNNGLSNLEMDKVILVDTTTHYRPKAQQTIHFIHGANPLGKCFLSNMSKLGAENSVDEFYHGWFAQGTKWESATSSEFGPPAGYLVGGINKSYTADTNWLPLGPVMKMYRDGGDGWPKDSWEITEPQIFYQAAYIRLLSEFVNTSSDTLGAVTTAITKPLSGQSILNQLNISTGNGFIRFSAQSAGVATLYSIRGQELARTNRTIEGTLGTTLASGIYLISFESMGGKQVRIVTLR